MLIQPITPAAATALPTDPETAGAAAAPAATPPDAAPTAADPATAAERRAGGKRHQSVLLIGRVSGASGAPVCLVHDISKAGMCARFDVPPAVGDVVTVEVRGLPAVTGTVRWVRGRKAGLQFAEAQNIDQVFNPRGDDGTVARPPRFPLSAPAQLRLDGRRIVAELLDLSAGGAKLALAAPGPRPGQTGAIHLLRAEAPIYGGVAWARDDRIGFRFARPLPLAQLTALLSPTG